MNREFADLFSKRTRWDRAENRLTLKLADLRVAGSAVLDLTQSNPTECGFSYDQAAMLDAIARPDMFHYRPHPRGLPGARDGVSAYYHEQRISVSPDDLILTSGTSEAYSFVFRLLCNFHDEVLIPSPGYPLFDFLADLCDVKLVRYPLRYDHGWQIDFSTLAAATSESTRALIIVHPNNPTGHYTCPAEQSKLKSFCQERGLALITDEVFLDFYLHDVRQRSFAGTDQVLTFTLSGISKICGLPQMKLAWIAVSGPAQQKKEALARLEIIADSYLSVGTPVQLAMPALLSTRKGFQDQVIARVNTNLRELDAQLSRQSACSRLSCEGGWSAVLRVPAVQSDEDLAISLLTQKGVHLHPGHFYDFPQAGYAVVSLIVPEDEFAEGIYRVLGHYK